MGAAHAVELDAPDTGELRLTRRQKLYNALDAALDMPFEARILVAHDDLDTEPDVWAWFETRMATHDLSIHVTSETNRELRCLLVQRGPTKIATIFWRQRPWVDAAADVQR